MERKVPFARDEFYHVYNRGVEKRETFSHQTDCDRFIESLYMYNSTKSFAFRDIRCAPLEFQRDETIVDVLAYALMPNHFHLILKEKKDGGISKFMAKIMTSYSMYFNTKHDRSGPLFCKPFRSQHIDSDEYFRWVFAYVHLNPIGQDLRRSGSKVQNLLQEHKYTSYADYFIADRAESKILSRDALPLEAADLLKMDRLLFEYQEAAHADTFRDVEAFLT